MAMVGSLFFVLFLVGLAQVGAVPKVPAIYVFGDSTADVGNNNYLPLNDSKANYPHYGVDFPHGRATGRFSNGYNGIDFFAIHMGFRRSPPPYLSLINKTGHQVFRGLQGANFASGGSGILNITGKTGSSITMAEQIQYFAKFHSDLTTRVGSKWASSLLSKSIFIVSSGGNDLFGFFSQTKSPNTTQAEQFINGTLSTYMDHLLTLYNLGARKFLIIDAPPVGCLPVARALNPSEGCIDPLNSLASSFNMAMKAFMSNLSPKLLGMKYSIGSSYAVTMTLIADPEYHGHTEVKNACCGAGKLNAQVRCNQNTTYCTDRNHYLFWDMMHPTQATAKKMARLASLDFEALSSIGDNYLNWKIDAALALKAQNLHETLVLLNKLKEEENSKALMLLRKHIHPDLKNEYLTVACSAELWKQLADRFHQYTSQA